MVQIKINKKIIDYQEKFLGFNAKHLLVVFIVAAVGLTTTITLSKYIGRASLIPTLIVAIVTALIVMFKHNELSSIACIKKAVKITKEGEVKKLDYTVDKGLVKLGTGTYLKLFELTDVNYETLSEESRHQFFINYFTFLNSMDSMTNYQISIVNRREQVNKDIYIRNSSTKKMNLVELEEEHNRHVTSRLSRMYRTRVILSISRKFMDDKSASIFFANTENTLRSVFESINVRKEEDIHLVPLSKESDIKKLLAIGGVKESYGSLKLDKKISKTFALNELPVAVNDQIIKHVKELDAELDMAIKLNTFEPEKAVKEITDIQFAADSDIRAFIKRHGDEKIPNKMMETIESCEHLLDTLRDGTQQLFRIKVLITLYGDDTDDLRKKESLLKSIFSRNMYKLTELTLQMYDGYIESLPFAIESGIQVRNTLLSEGVATFMPFTYYNLEIQPGGVFYGINKLTKQPILVNKRNGANSNSFIIGKSGGGKSFNAKNNLPFETSTLEHLGLFTTS